MPEMSNALMMKLLIGKLLTAGHYTNNGNRQASLYRSYGSNEVFCRRLIHFAIGDF